MKNQKVISIITIVIFIGILFGLAAAFVIKPAKDFSPEEKRKLQTFPEFKWQDFIDGKFTAKINEYLNDQFPFRSAFVDFEATVEKLLMKKENNGVVFGKNGQLAVRLFSAHDGKPHDESYNYPMVDFFYEKHVAAQLSVVKNYFDKFDELGVAFTALIPPRTIDVASSAFNYPSEKSDKLIAFVKETLKGENYIDYYSNFRALYDNGEYVYFKTDHHWTTLGAYYAYVEVMKSFGMEYYSKEDFDVITASDSFYGTTYAKAGDKSIPADVLDYWVLKGDSPDNYTMEVYDGKTWTTFSGFYDFDYLDKIKEGSDKYSMFLSATNPLTYITKNGDEGRETLLLIKDSFGHSLAPFLALHFDLVIVDIGDVANKVLTTNTFDVDRVLLCVNLENVVTMNFLGKAVNAYKLVKAK